MLIELELEINLLHDFLVMVVRKVPNAVQHT